MKEAIKDPVAEQDAQTIADVWANQSKEAALIKFREIAELRDMKITDVLIMLERITEILCISNFTIK